MPNEYLQIDLGGEYWICGVATQGEGSASSPDEWTTKFKLNLSVNTDSNWNIYQWNGSDKVGPVRVEMKNSLTFPDLEQNFTDLKHGNAYRNLTCFVYFFSFLFYTFSMLSSFSISFRCSCDLVLIISKMI